MKAEVKIALGQFRLAVSHAHSLIAEAEFQVMRRLDQVEAALRTLRRIALATVVVSEPADVFMRKLDILLGTTGEMTSLFPAASGLLS